MTVESALQRVGALQQALSDPSTLLTAARTGGTAAPTAPTEGLAEGDASSAVAPSFADALQSASSGYGQAAAGAGSAGAASAGAGYPQALGSYSPASAGYAPGLTGYAPGMTGYAGASGLAAAAPYGSSAIAPSGLPGALPSSPGARVAAIAETQIGQSEQPPGSNEGPAIAEYRSATAGAAPGEPWCAYFASWAARQAGVPLGANGEGLGSVSEIWSWAQSAGRVIPNGPGVTPQPGDLIVFGSEHVGIVKDVLPNGQVQTIEGNYGDKVSENVRSPSEATGYVRLG